VAITVNLHSTGTHDWPAFRGPRRDGVIDNVRLDPDWDLHPPTIVWQQPVGVGWSSYVIAGGFAVTQEQRGPDEAVVCYDVATGREIWEHRDKARFHEMMGGDGPRATPTLDDGDVYSLGATGILNRLRGRDGRVVWSVNIIDDAHAPTSLFGMTGSPLIWKDLVVVNPGGPNASLVAYDKQTGKRRWAAGLAATAYASPQAVHLGGRDQILTFNAEGVFSHATNKGEILWNHPWVTPPENNNVCQPIFWTDDTGVETVFLSSGYGKGCGLLEIANDADRFTVVPRWQNKNLKVKFSSAVARDGCVFGLDENILVCLDLRTGQRRWKGGRYGFGQLLLVDRILLVLSDSGEVILCEATPERHHELARLPVLNGRTWNHPALSGDTLLIRNDRAAACLKLPLADK
jgi:outer membrane protein assembly factor BamB